MWRLGEEQRAIFDELIVAGANAASTKKSLMSRRICRESGEDGPTVSSLLKTISADEVAAIYRLLPASVEFYKFVDSLAPAPQTSHSLSSSGAEDADAERARRAKYKARLQRLREAQESREYMEMTKSIDTRFSNPHSGANLMRNFGQEMRSVNRQMIAVVNALITIGGAFVFGFYGINMAYPHLHLDMGTRMILGLVFATIVLIADFYFLIKNME